jgi:hypothetical protein
MLSLTILPSDIVAAVLDNDLPDHMTLLDLAINPLVSWEEHRERFGE